MKAIRLSTRALGYTSRRGFTVSEVEEAISHFPMDAGAEEPVGVSQGFSL